MITERLMLPGSWEITLLEDTPKTTRDLCDYFGHIYILPSPVDPRKLSDASIKADARYCGIVRTKKDAFSLGGPGPIAWLGDEQSKGWLYEVARTYTNGTFTQWAQGLLPASAANAGDGAVVSGTITSIAGTLTHSFIWVTPRYALDETIVKVFGGVYRVNPDFTFDAGPASALFKVTPTAVVQRLPGGRDTSIVGIEASQLDLEKDADDYSTRVAYFGNGASSAATISPVTSYKDGRGNGLQLTRVVTNTLTPAAVVGAYATAEAAKTQPLHTQVTLSTTEYDIGRDAKPGDNLYVFDPTRGIYDVTPPSGASPIRYRGSVLFPMTVQVLASTWPVERGMGVYYRDLNGVYTDLTPFVDYAKEQPGASLEVGAALRRLT